MSNSPLSSPSAPGPTREERHAAARSAAFELAELMGFDPLFFHFPGREADRALHGSAALAAEFELVDHFGRFGPGTGRRGTDPGLRERTRAAYARQAWMPVFHAANAAFLAHEAAPGLPSPLSGGQATVLGSVTVQHQQFTLALDGGRPMILMTIGYLPVGILYPTERLFLVTTDFGLNMPLMPRVMLDAILTRPLPWMNWIRTARAGHLRQAYVIGDNRPGHFIKQSLAFLDRHEADLIGFAGRGGLLVQVPDWCAMDPFTIIPALAPLERVSVESAALLDRILAEGWDAHRVYRFSTHANPLWLRRRFEAIAPGEEMGEEALPERRFRVMISIDAERQRVLNQEEAFRYVLTRLGEACARDGRDLEVAWDGWTVPDRPAAKDLEVIERIEGIVARILEGLPVRIARQHRFYGRSAQAKVALTAGCDLAFVTQGTGAVIPCWLLRRPTIVYHVASMVRDRSCLDEGAAFSVDQRAVEEPGDPELVARRCFRLAPWGLEEAMQRALAGSLPPGNPALGVAS
ncbi:hypothetical protein VQH23_25880 [Pararoseomonas sp. SCSIO 73927]|uniref:hypothetical protein n=1 Tax=Pararoseomonas sp. SCSIO 73927 TaxID=3114537 RepID=UPI0030D4382A